MAGYEVLITPSAVKEIDTIGSKKDRQRVYARLRKLAESPHPAGCEKLSGQDKYRIRQGDYRIIYEVDDCGLAVTVVKVGHRREVYP